MKNVRTRNLFIKFYLVSILTILFLGCENDSMDDFPIDPEKATVVSIDRFSDEAATLMKRSNNSALPAANEPVNFDQGDFITQSFGPDGQVVKYYNFDVQPLAPAPLYVLLKDGQLVEGQLNIIDVIPGDIGYNDFWVVYEVTVPSDYVANTVTSYQDIINRAYSVKNTTTLVNCPVVPKGSIASKRLGSESTALDRGWYKGQVVYYFTFMEKELETNSAGLTPISPIYVTFNINPDDENPNSGPPSGFVTEPGTVQTHNVIATVPSDSDYSPLWSVYVYDNTDFEDVSDLETVEESDILAEGVMYVNCPVVYIE
jgi:hypothetical protein